MTRAVIERRVIEAQAELTRQLLAATLGDLLELDLSMAQLKALAVIDRQPNCSIGMLSEQLGVKAPAASLLVDKLVGGGLVYRRRDSGDGRRVIVCPTGKGSDLVSRIRHGRHSLLERWVERLTEDELTALARGLQALAAIARRFSGGRADQAVEAATSRAER